MATETIQAKIARLEVEKKAREDAAQQLVLERKVLFLELEAKFSEDGSKSGVDFEIVSTVYGPIVLKRGPSMLFEKFFDSEGTPSIAHQLEHYVTPQVVYPTREEFAEIVDKQMAVVARCSAALHKLHGMKTKAIEGEF